MPTKKNLDNELELKPYSPSFDTFKKEPVTFLLVNALRHLTQDQQRQLCNALQERLPVPASIEQEAEAFGEENGERITNVKEYLTYNDLARGYITAARQYMGEIERLQAALTKIEGIARRFGNGSDPEKDIELIETIAAEALK